MLVLVLAMLVVLSLVAGTVAAITSRLVAQSQQRAQYMQDEVDIASTRATILYLMMSQRVTVRGITVDNLVSFGEDGVREIQSPADLDSSLPIGNEIVPDGRVYRAWAMPVSRCRTTMVCLASTGVRQPGWIGCWQTAAVLRSQPRPC
ncbi:hypothetical protein [Thermomonas carbonis]|uniref:hypothetical protein n=1 Tax=Thermomonas carbonis TaxID=1463158 RepID=UPI001F1F5418|nr:hypothetical protein [Thermomonas carbonis]